MDTTRHLSSILGTDLKTGREVVISQQARQQGLYIIGANGTGKTTLLCNMILSDIRQGLAVGLVEPHGDLTSQILAGIPRHRLNDIVYLDVEDYEAPFGLNIFEVPQPRTIRTMAATASFISHLWEVLWNSGFDTPRLMQNLRAVTRTIIENPGTTFAEIPLLYANERVRQQMLANVINPSILQYWDAYERKNQRDKDAYTESTMNKVTAFLDEPMIRNILAQSKTTINFRRIMDESKILLIKLSPQFEEASTLIGSILIGKILMAAFLRTDTSENNRRQFNLYVDEFQRFASSDFATLISEARKFKIATCMSHQFIDQLEPRNQAACLAAGNLIVFRVSAEDGKTLSPSFKIHPDQTQQVVGDEPIRRPTPDPLSHLVRHGHSNPTVAKFTAEYLMSLEALLKTVSVYTHPFALGCMMLYPSWLIEGQRLLNEVFSSCQRTGRADVHIAPLALLTLGGAWDSSSTYIFADHVKRTPFNAWVIEAIFDSAKYYGRPDFLQNRQAVDALVKKHDKRGFWATLFNDPPLYPAKAFLKMLRALREVMAILAREPILVDTGQFRPRIQPRSYQDVENEISNSLSNQPNYTARVKILTQEAVIRTKPAPQTLTGNALAERLQAIKKHMRTLGYTRHYLEVEREIRQRQERYQGRMDTPPPTTTNGRRRPTPQPARPTPTRDEPPPTGAFPLD